MRQPRLQSFRLGTEAFDFLRASPRPLQYAPGRPVLQPPIQFHASGCWRPRLVAGLSDNQGWDRPSACRVRGKNRDRSRGVPSVGLDGPSGERSNSSLPSAQLNLFRSAATPVGALWRIRTRDARLGDVLGCLCRQPFYLRVLELFRRSVAAAPIGRLLSPWKPTPSSSTSTVFTDASALPRKSVRDDTSEVCIQHGTANVTGRRRANQAEERPPSRQ